MGNDWFYLRLDLVYLYDKAMLHPQWILEESRRKFWTELYVVGTSIEMILQRER
jgi:hypothetical protein